MEAQPAAAAGAGASALALRLWGSLDLRRIDIISDFGAGPNDPFLLEFDSLFLLACADPAADWRHGCQTLNLVWLVESAVRRLRERDAHVRIVAFDAHAALWSRAAGPLRLARAVVLRHVTWLAKEGKADLLRFAGWASADWAAFLAAEQPSLLLVSSGHVPPSLAAAAGPAEHLEAAFRALSVSCVMQRLPVALTTGLEFRGAQAVAHACSGPPSLPPGSSREAVLAALAALCPAAPPAPSPPSTEAPGGTASARLRLLAAAVRAALGPGDGAAGRALLLHGAMLDRLPLTHRSLGRVPVCGPAAALFERACAALAAMPCDLDPLPSADLVDGRLLHALVAGRGGSDWSPAALGLDAAAAEELARLWRWAAGGDFWAPLELQAAFELDETEGSGSEDDAEAGSSVLLPISSPVLDAYFEQTPFGRPPDGPIEDEEEAPVCVERYHWHSGRDIVGDDGELVDSSDEDDARYRARAGPSGVTPRHWRMLQRVRARTAHGSGDVATEAEMRLVDEWRAQEKRTLDQKYMRWLQRYAESLGAVQPVRFATAARGQLQQAADPEPEGKPARWGKQKAAAPKRSAKALAIIEQNKKQLGKKQADADEEKVENFFRESCEPLLDQDPERAVALLSGFIAEKLAGGSREGRLKARMRLLELYERAWTAKPEEPPNLERAARLYSMIVRTRDEFDLKDGEELKALCEAMCRLGYPEVADLLWKRPSKAKSKAPGAGRPAGVSPARLQMGYGGRYMERSVDPSPDGRVLFVPDRWQRDLLDVVDRGDSALVVAPTSAGKTFAAYYAMEKVLRADDEGVCVFVSPTKALVNQVSAEVYARFGSKQYGDGSCVVGVKTRDYNHRSLDCQVLVTVPGMLEILLLSPLEAVQTWCRRIRFVIFDEVHCIGLDANTNRESGSGESGAVWEHLLVLIRCPFLALSATISNPEDLRSWMAQKQGGENRRVQLVQFDVRYSDLRKHVFTRSGEIRTIHPFASLTAAKMRRGGIPRDMALAPEESLQLYEEMRVAAERCGALADEREAREMRELDPDVFFRKQNLCITKARAREFEAALKSTFERWSASPAGGRPAASAGAALRSLSAAADAAFGDEGVDEAEEEDEEGDRTPLDDRFLPLLRALQQEDKLPAIGFCFDRALCESLALLAAGQLEQDERRWREETPEGRRRVRERESKAKQRRAERARKEKQLERARGQRQREELESTGFREELAEDFEEGGEACEDEFTFVRRADGLSPKEYAELEAGLRRELSFKQQLPRYEPLLAALRRGIGVHHAGLLKKYREAVEVLFRSRHVRVVLATGTLALGINMPCRTVVMVGDSVYLTPLQYRQTSGRAGRRGFDDLGHVVFLGLPRARVDRLLTADIPRIRGHFPLTVSLVLRAMCLYTQAGLLLPGAASSARAAERARCAERARDLVLGLFRQPLLAVGRRAPADQVYHQCAPGLHDAR